MKKIYTLAAAAMMSLSALAQPQILTPANGEQVPVAYPSEGQYVLQRVAGETKSPAYATALNLNDLSGTYIDTFRPVGGLPGRNMSRTVTVSQTGNTLLVDGLGGWGQAALAGNTQFDWIGPVKMTLDPQTGKLTVKMGQAVAVLKNYNSSNIVPYVGLFEYTDPAGNYLGYGNYDTVAGHVEGDRIVFDFNPVFLWFSGSVPGSMSNSPISGEFGPLFRQANGVLSYLATDQAGVTEEYTLPVWFGYGHDADGNHTLEISHIYAVDGGGYSVTFNLSDDKTAIATDQVVWGTTGSPYYFTARSQRGGFKKTVGADVTERQNIKWPVKLDNTNYVAWTIMNTVTGDYLTNNEPATLTGLWYENYPTLCMLNDAIGWDPSKPTEANTNNGIYEFEVPAGVTEVAISTVKGASMMDTQGFESGLIVTEMLGAVEPGQKYYLINGASVEEDVIVLPEHSEPAKLYVDIDFMELWVEMVMPQAPAISVTFEGETEPVKVEANAEGIFSFVLPESTKSFLLADTEGRSLVTVDGAVIADNTGATDYSLMAGDGDICVAYPNGSWTICVDLENARIWGVNSTDAPSEETLKIYWDNTSSNYEAPYLHYSLDYGATFDYVEMERVAGEEAENAPRKASSDLWHAEIPANATDIYFSDRGQESGSTENFTPQEGTYDYTGLVGIETIASDIDRATATYYTLQGVRIDRPAAGSIVVRVSADGRATKVMVR